MKDWVKKYIFDSYWYDNECHYIRLFGIMFDFRQWYVIKDGINDNYWFNQYEVEYDIEEIKKKNAKRKNKLPIPNYEKLPWYKTLIRWNRTPHNIRSVIYFILGLLSGYLLGVIL